MPAQGLAYVKANLNAALHQTLEQAIEYESRSMVLARNVSLTLHRSVTAASVVAPGQQGRTGFALGQAASVQRTGAVRPHFAAVGRDASGAVTVTVEVVGGGGALIKLTGDAAAMNRDDDES